MAAPRGDLGKIIQKWGLLCGSDGKESAYNARDMGSIPRSRSFPGGLINLNNYMALEKGMASHSSTLAWRIPWTEESGGLQSMGSHRVGHD